MSRFILDILAIKHNDNNSRIHTSQWKTLRFATRVEAMADGLGGELHNSFLEYEGDLEEDRDGGYCDETVHDIDLNEE